MTWSRSEIQYEGFPLLLRRPDYPNIWNYKEKFNLLIGIDHLLEKVSCDGLPQKSYNSTLADFDEHMCNLFDDTNNGIIILIETFSGKRSYYYYTASGFDIDQIAKQIEDNFKVKLRVRCKVDTEWKFIRSYHVQLYSE